MYCTVVKFISIILCMWFLLKLLMKCSQICGISSFFSFNISAASCYIASLAFIKKNKHLLCSHIITVSLWYYFYLILCLMFGTRGEWSQIIYMCIIYILFIFYLFHNMIVNEECSRKLDLMTCLCIIKITSETAFLLFKLNRGEFFC